MSRFLLFTVTSRLFITDLNLHLGFCLAGYESIISRFGFKWPNNSLTSCRHETDEVILLFQSPSPIFCMDLKLNDGWGGWNFLTSFSLMIINRPIYFGFRLSKVILPCYFGLSGGSHRKVLEGRGFELRHHRGCHCWVPEQKKFHKFNY